MNVTTTKNDDLAHIAYENEKADVNDPKALFNQVSSTAGRITIISAFGCSLVLEYSVGVLAIEVALVLETPVGNKTLGTASLNPQKPTATIGGSIGGFKAEATISFDFSTKVLKLEGEICAPFLGCKKGSTSIHL